MAMSPLVQYYMSRQGGPAAVASGDIRSVKGVDTEGQKQSERYEQLGQASRGAIDGLQARVKARQAADVRKYQTPGE